MKRNLVLASVALGLLATSFVVRADGADDIHLAPKPWKWNMSVTKTTSDAPMAEKRMLPDPFEPARYAR